MKKYRWDKKYLYWGVTAFIVIVTSITFFLLLDRLDTVGQLIKLVLGALMPIIYGLCFAYVLNKAMIFVEKRFISKLAGRIVKNNEKRAKKVSRMLSIIVVLLLAMLLITGLLMFILPQIFLSIVRLVNKSGEYISAAVEIVREIFHNDEVFTPVITRWLETFSGNFFNWIEVEVLPKVSVLITGITGGVVSAVKVMFAILVGIVISVYVLYNKETFCAQSKKILYGAMKPATANKTLDELNFINKAFGDYIVGTLLDALIIGSATYAFTIVMGMQYKELIAIIVGVTNMIPVFGPFIGAVPPTLLLFLENPIHAVAFVIFVIVMQQIDGNVLKPRIFGSQAGISGFWIMFAILFFGGVFGIVGMALGVPVMTVLYSAVTRMNKRHLREKGLPVSTAKYMDLDHIDTETLEPVYKSDLKNNGEEKK